MAVSKDEILDTISNMTVMEVVDLISAMEEKFGVSAAAAVAASPAGGAGEAAAPAEEQTEFDVVMSSFGANKVSVIKGRTCAYRPGFERSKRSGRGSPVNDQGRHCQG